MTNVMDRRPPAAAAAAAAGPPAADAAAHAGRRARAVEGVRRRARRSPGSAWGPTTSSTLLAHEERVENESFPAAGI